MEEMKGLGFLKLYSSSGTVTMYRITVKNYLAFIYGKAIENGDLGKAAESYFTEGRSYQQDVDNYIASVKGDAPKTRKFKQAVIKTYLSENGVDLPVAYWRRLRDRIKGSRALTLDRPPTSQELKTMINFMPVHGKALYLMLASSGMRIGEALRLTEKDVDLNVSPAKVSIQGTYTKTGNSRITFISGETSEMIQQWLKVKDDYLRTAASRSKRHDKDTEDPRIFPFDTPTAYSIWMKAAEKAKLAHKGNGTDRMILHPHVLRKFFRSKMGTVIPVDIAEALMGHEGYLTEVYRRYTAEDLAEFYKKGEHSLLVFGNGQDVAKLRGEIEEKSKTLNEGMATLALKNADLENRLTALISDNEGMKSRIVELEEGDRKFREGFNDWQAKIEKVIEQLANKK